MVISDHNSHITDLAFSHDDAAIFTSSADGAVYKQTLYSSARDGEVGGQTGHVLTVDNCALND
jgi:hypothetical protein